ncbi:MAG: hypothetical protein ACMXYL_02970 [Candidatus Woesearchaeota archaeon]
MRLLIVNAGSSSLKWTLYDNGIINTKEYSGLNNDTKYNAAVNKMADDKSITDIELVIHRIVHGYGLKKTVYYNNNVRKKIIAGSKIAPLHNNRALMAIDALNYKIAKQACVFDSLPYTDLEEYPLPNSIIKKYNIKRFGFHGLSHLAMRGAYKEKNIITAHLGSGSSITGWKDNKTVYHSMGFSPNEGMIMMTRTGSIDSGIILLLQEEGHTSKMISDIINKQSGMLALCSNNDFKTIIERKKKNNKYHVAYKYYIMSCAEHILKATVRTGKPGRIIFTGGIGEKSKSTVRDIMRLLPYKANYSQHSTDENTIIIREAAKLMNSKK